MHMNMPIGGGDDPEIEKRVQAKLQEWDLERAFHFVYCFRLCVEALFAFNEIASFTWSHA